MQIAHEAQNLNDVPPKNDKTFSDAESLDTWLDSVRRQHNLPAMGAIVFRADSVLARGIAGVRRANAPDLVELSDRFQLGSNTKAITATVVARLVEEGKLTWTTTLVLESSRVTLFSKLSITQVLPSPVASAVGALPVTTVAATRFERGSTRETRGVEP